MCGRYIFFDGKNEKIRNLIETARQKLGEEKLSKVSLQEVFPGQNAFVGIDTGSHMSTKIMHWGYESRHGTVINARCETAFTSPFFAGSLPCAVIASSYFEWSKDHQKYGFFADASPIYLAGLARREKDGWHFVILTENANGLPESIHDRQPVMFTYEDAKKWCASEHPTFLLAKSIRTRYAYKA
jgi:putative SOS response-associated peptidase YedK